MKKFLHLITLICTALVFAQTTVLAQTDKIKFDKDTYNIYNYTEKPPEYDYFIKGETPDSWHSKITLSNHNNLTNATEAAADYAHKIQEQTSGASVLVYPDVAMVEYITFPNDRKYYEYNALIYRPAAKGLDMFRFAKRFYSCELNGTEGARKAAITFAQENSVKYMQLVNKVSEKYKVD